MILKNTNILVTGATGFVGRALCKALMQQPGYSVLGVARTLVQNSAQFKDFEAVDVCSHALSDSLLQVEVIIHLAARVHILRDEAQDPLAEFRRTNVDGTIRLAKQAAAAGVKRFIFLSSVKVHGEQSTAGSPFCEQDLIAPADPYGMSKWEAEQALRAIEKETTMEVVIIRPPLVYGEGVKANFRKLLEVVAKGVPLPLGLVNNYRSFVGLHNLINFILLCMVHPKAAGETFLISDGEDMSTPELIRRIAISFNITARLIAIPLWMMRFSATVLGKRMAIDRLLGSLQVDSSKARDLLGWQAVMSVQEQLALIAQDLSAYS